ncbi:MFS transporter [Nocardiopsis gilva YIM 90087]|uniref:MFS transporter n=1 Tax=Nocardiopsis gilva YIM 90087 TaxID=1235441 RepID=A0A223S6G6_9ACTN|nr:MFS transporter [Nocardiopsis gilva YIM 90087]
MTASTPRSSAPTAVPVRTWKIAAVTGAGAFIAMLDSTVANLALESIRSDTGSTLPMVQWVATGYLIALAVSLPVAGWLGIRFGQGRVWAVSLAVFTAASALCALSPGTLFLIAARFVQGLAAGVMVPVGQAVLGSSAERDQLGRVMGLSGMVVSLGPAVGPAVGGLLLEVASWQWLFWMNVPIGVAALIGARGLAIDGVVDPDRRLDLRGLALLGLGLPLVLYGATEIGATGTTAVTVLAVCVGTLLAAGFVVSALRTERPLIELRLLRRARFAAATLTAGLTGANMYGGLLLLPLYLQLVAAQDSLVTGLMLLAMGLGSAVALYVAGTMSDRFGAGPVCIIGAVLLVGATLPFLFSGALPLYALAAILVVRGVALALGQMPAITAAYASVSAEQMGDATTLVNIVQRVGGALGAAAVVIVLTQTGGSSDPAAYPWGFGLLAVVSGLTVVTAAFLWRKAAGSSRTPPPTPRATPKPVRFRRVWPHSGTARSRESRGCRR